MRGESRLMSPRAALALVRAPSLAPRVSVPTLRRPSLRAAAVGLALLAAAAAAYALARETPLFAVHAVELRGASGAVAADVRPVLDALAGESLVALDRRALERRLRAVPSVRAASVDRAFPHTLVVAVTPERPLAVVRVGGRAWLVSDTGRVIRGVEPQGRARLPRIRAELARAPKPGAVLAGAAAPVALAVLREARPAFRARILYVAVAERAVSLELRDGPEVRLGVPLDVREKLAAAAAVLRSLAAEGVVPEYVDVSVPERVVASGNAQPES